MSTATVNRTDLDTAYRDMLRLAMGLTIKVELSELPVGLNFDDQGRLVDPYIIIYPLRTTRFWGSFESHQSNAVVPYQHTCVGRNREQAQRTADRAREAVLKRNPNGDFTNPITASDALVIDRTCDTQGGPEPSGGGLWQAVDRFNLEVSSV